MRVYHLSRESGLAGRILLQMLRARGVEVPSHMSVLEEAHAAVLREAIAAQKAGGPALAAGGAAAAAGARRPSAVPLLPGVAGRKRGVEEDAKPVKAGTSKKRKGRDEKREELSEELLEDGIDEIIEVDPAALPGLTAPRTGAPAPVQPDLPDLPDQPDLPDVPDRPEAPVFRPMPMPTAPVEQRLTRLEQRRAPRTLVRQRRRGRQEPTLAAMTAIQCPITVKELSQVMSVRAQNIIKSLMQSGVMANINSSLEEETVQVLALEFNREIQIKKRRPEAEHALEGLDIDVQDPDRLEPRPAVVAVLGHVDHGKTSLLDAIRKTDVAAHEAGGITQHIGAYQVRTDDGRLVTFLDTPGHEAFTAMRARGANVADVVILVVAADDGVMPQTEEAISHARAAGVPIVVALNKIDKAQANKDRVLNQLATLGLSWEKWGGDTIIEPVAATKGEGVAELVKAVALTAEMQELVADPHRRAAGTVIEASKGNERGVLATFLVQQGTLRVGDIVLAGTAYGRVRSLQTEKGEEVDEAPPSTPVQVTGLGDVPAAGAPFYVLEDLSTAKQISDNRQTSERADSRVARPAMTLENVFAQIKEEGENEVRVILKADVKGSVEALEKKLGELKTPEVGVRVLHGGVGAITESDVKLAVASRAIVIGFHVLAENLAKEIAEREKIQIRTYQIIYEVVDDLRKAMEGLLVPEQKEEILGHATVKEIFAISKVGTIAGCAVSDGVVKRTGLYRLFRDGKQSHTGLKLESLKRFKDDVKEVKGGFECGLKIAGHDDIKVGDVLECYEVIEVKRTLK